MAAGSEPNLRDLNCAICGRPMTEVLEAIEVSNQARPLPMVRYADRTARLVCGGCDPADATDERGGE